MATKNDAFNNYINAVDIINSFPNGETEIEKWAHAQPGRVEVYLHFNDYLRDYAKYQKVQFEEWDANIRRFIKEVMLKSDLIVNLDYEYAKAAEAANAQYFYFANQCYFHKDTLPPEIQDITAELAAKKKSAFADKRRSLLRIGLLDPSLADVASDEEIETIFAKMHGADPFSALHSARWNFLKEKFGIPLKKIFPRSVFTRVEKDCLRIEQEALIELSPYFKPGDFTIKDEMFIPFTKEAVATMNLLMGKWD
jgi:hypothetical protein